MGREKVDSMYAGGSSMSKIYQKKFSIDFLGER